jgi:diacylglycerol O-acyltransferase
VRISVAILSHVNSVSFGVTADYDAALDLDTFTEGIRRGLAELGGEAGAA